MPAGSASVNVATVPVNGACAVGRKVTPAAASGASALAATAALPFAVAVAPPVSTTLIVVVNVPAAA